MTSPSELGLTSKIRSKACCERSLGWMAGGTRAVYWGSEIQRSSATSTSLGRKRALYLIFPLPAT